MASSEARGPGKETGEPPAVVCSESADHGPCATSSILGPTSEPNRVLMQQCLVGDEPWLCSTERSAAREYRDWRWYSAPLQVASILPPRKVDKTRGVLLLDRDGTLIVDKGYLADPSAVDLVPEAVAVFRYARMKGWAVGLITNQGGIALGRFGWRDLALVQEALYVQLQEAGLELDLALACPCHPEAKNPALRHARGRKPHPGMVELAAHLLGCTADTYFLVIGDKASDVALAKAASCTGLRVETRSRASSGGAWCDWQAVRDWLDRVDQVAALGGDANRE